MESLNHLLAFMEEENRILIKQVEETDERWDSFWKGFTSHVSVFTLDGRPILGPVVSCSDKIT